MRCMPLTLSSAAVSNSSNQVRSSHSSRSDNRSRHSNRHSTSSRHDSGINQCGCRTVVRAFGSCCLCLPVPFSLNGSCGGPVCCVQSAHFVGVVCPVSNLCPPAGEGKPRMLDEKETTVYKRALDMAYNLKIKASRAVFGEVRATLQQQ